MNTLENRIQNIPESRILTALTTLEHFSIVTFLVESDKLRKVIPNEFDLYVIKLNRKSYGLISAVSFIDKDFRFKNILPYITFQFPQTNYRAYVIHKKIGEQCAWFFGTALGSRFVFIPRHIWNMPWFYSDYSTHFIYKQDKYQSYQINIKANRANASIDISENSNLYFNYEGFMNQQEAELILTHPVTGYFSKADHKIGCYKIWHPKMAVRNAQSKLIYFEKFERLRLLSREEMKTPYSILLTNKIDFIIDLPPQSVSK